MAVDREVIKVKTGTRLKCKICGSIFTPKLGKAHLMEECSCGAVYLYQNQPNIFHITVDAMYKSVLYDDVIEVIKPGEEPLSEDEVLANYLMQYGGGY